MGCVSSKSDDGAGAAESMPLDPAKDDTQKQLDARLPFANYREFFTLKNYWKAAGRREKECAKGLLYKFIMDNPTYGERYKKLKSLNMADKEAVMASTGFEKLSLEYLQLFDDVINSVEASPSDATHACNTLKDIGKQHKQHCSGMDSAVFQSMEEPFMKMVEMVLDDRYNDKSEMLFRKFFQFCLKYLVEGFNS